MRRARAAAASFRFGFPPPNFDPTRSINRHNGEGRCAGDLCGIFTHERCASKYVLPTQSSAPQTSLGGVKKKRQELGRSRADGWVGKSHARSQTPVRFFLRIESVRERALVILRERSDRGIAFRPRSFNDLTGTIKSKTLRRYPSLGSG
jgi:hypothetical protein